MATAQGSYTLQDSTLTEAGASTRAAKGTVEGDPRGGAFDGDRHGPRESDNPVEFDLHAHGPEEKCPSAKKKAKVRGQEGPTFASPRLVIVRGSLLRRRRCP